jgi:hypothetical protein
VNENKPFLAKTVDQEEYKKDRRLDHDYNCIQKRIVQKFTLTAGL